MHALRLGYLKPGDRLPKVRDVVASLAINPNTVLKAYKELEVKGLAAGRPGQGTFIQATLTQVALPELTALRRAATASARPSSKRWSRRSRSPAQAGSYRSSASRNPERKVRGRPLATRQAPATALGAKGPVFVQ
jgi:DNA-binding GntR family transcriptional regulator